MIVRSSVRLAGQLYKQSGVVNEFFRSLIECAMNSVDFLRLTTTDSVYAWGLGSTEGLFLLRKFFSKAKVNFTGLRMLTTDFIENSETLYPKKALDEKNSPSQIHRFGR